MSIETEGTPGNKPSTEAFPKAVPAKAAPKDPVVQALIAAILVIIALALVTVVYVVATGVMGSGAPKTAGEAKIMGAEAKINAGNKEGAVWVAYINALIGEKKYAEAQQWIDKGKKTLQKQESSQDMNHAQALLYAAQGNLPKALTTAQDAIKAIKKANREAILNDKKSGNPSEAAYLAENANYWDLLLLEADIYERQNDLKNAIAAYDVYLAGQDTAATVFVQRGEDKEKLGDKKGAEADYRKALAFIPDNADALAGMKRIGVSK